MALNVIMLGPPGAGKGTQAERLARARGIPKISTGDILREAVHAGTELGRVAKAAMDAGRLVSDEVMIGIVRERLARPDAQNGFVLDGFPRTVGQAQALDEILDRRGPLYVIEIDVPGEELVRRLTTRLICVSCGATAPPDGAAVCQRCGGELVQRSDDREDVIRERLAVFRRETSPLVDHYRRRRTFRLVRGDQPPDRVTADLDAAIDALAARPARARSDRRMGQQS
jgi:adenylate kinase